MDEHKFKLTVDGWQLSMLSAHYWSDWIDTGEWIANFSLFYRNRLPLHSRGKASEIGSGRVKLDLLKDRDWKVNRTSTEELGTFTSLLTSTKHLNVVLFSMNPPIFVICFSFLGHGQLVLMFISHCARGRVHTGQAANPSQGHRKTNNYFHSHTHARTV